VAKQSQRPTDESGPELPHPAGTSTELCQHFANQAAMMQLFILNLLNASFLFRLADGAPVAAISVGSGQLCRISQLQEARKTLQMLPARLRH
jgi:hypothetical protein